MSAPKPGTPAYALAALDLLATNRALVETDGLNTAQVSMWGGLSLLYRTEGAAHQAAAHLDIMTPPQPIRLAAFDGYTRSGSVAGVAVRVESLWDADTTPLAGAA